MPTMTLSNKLIAVLLSFALVFSFTPSVALADEGTNWQDSEETAIENENIDMGENVLDAASGSESESQDGAADEDVSDNEASTTETVTGLESTVGSDENNATGSVLKEIVDVYKRQVVGVLQFCWITMIMLSHLSKSLDGRQLPMKRNWYSSC